ncbi:hypothetical protein Tco_0259974 [Tanacetum coccineum]
MEDDQEKTVSSTQDINTVGPSINTASININTGSLNINTGSPNNPNMPSLEETGIFDGAYDDEDVGAEAGNLTIGDNHECCPYSTTRIHKYHPKNQIIRDLNLSTQTRRMINFSEENAIMEVYVCPTPWFEDTRSLEMVYKVEEALYGLHQAPKDWSETWYIYYWKWITKVARIVKNLFIKKNRDDAHEILD